MPICTLKEFLTAVVVPHCPYWQWSDSKWGKFIGSNGGQNYHFVFLQGSLCKDIATSCFCSWCSWCQMHRELKHRKKTPVVVNMQPARGAKATRNPPPAGVVVASYWDFSPGCPILLKKFDLAKIDYLWCDHFVGVHCKSWLLLG